MKTEQKYVNRSIKEVEETSIAHNVVTNAKKKNQNRVQLCAENIMSLLTTLSV